MNNPLPRNYIQQLRRMLRRLMRSHSGDENSCPTCSLQRLGAELVEEMEMEAMQLDSPEIRPGAACVTLATEALIGLIYALDVQGADEQARVLQAALDHIGDSVLDQLAQEEMGMSGEEPPENPPPAPVSRRGGSLH